MRRTVAFLIVYATGAALTFLIAFSFDPRCVEKGVFQQHSVPITCAFKETDPRRRTIGSVVFWPFYVLATAADALHKPGAF